MYIMPTWISAPFPASISYLTFQIEGLTYRPYTFPNSISPRKYPKAGPVGDNIALQEHNAGKRC